MVHQDVEGVRHSVAGGCVVDTKRRVGLVLGPCDRGRTLVTDPVFVHSTDLGGSGDELDPLYGGEVGVAVDAAGNAYVTGTTMSADFPTTGGADRTPGRNQDAFVTKLSRTGAVRYSTYVGGPRDDVARTIAVHPTTGEAHITGRVNDRVYSRDGARTTFSVTPTNWLVRLAVAPLTVAFDSGTRQALRYGGRVPPLRVVNGKAREFDARVEYTMQAAAYR